MKPKVKRTNPPPPAGPLELEGTVAIAQVAAAEAGQSGTRPTFEINAYNGGAVQLSGYYYPVVIDLSGLRAKPRTTVLLQHDATQIVGQATKTTIGKSSITVSGSITGENQAALEVIAQAKNGFVWAASIGVMPDPTGLEYVDEKTNVRVNGQKFQGPIYVTRSGRLGEVSLVAVGADEDAAAKIAACAAGVDPMTFEAWLKAHGFELQTLSDDQKKILAASWSAEQKAAAADADESEGGAPETPPNPSPIEAQRAAAKTEADRLDALAKIFGDKHPALLLRANAEGWSADKATLEMERAERPKPPAVHVHQDVITPQVLEASVRMSTSEPLKLVEHDYKPEVLELASKRRSSSIRGLIEMACRIDGVPVPSISADVKDWLKAGFSTTSLAGILSNAAGKIMLAAYQNVPISARILCKKLSATDFKEHTGYRLAGDTKLQKISGDGEIKHGTLEQGSFTFQVDTYAKLIALTRQQWFNDDLNAFTQIPQAFGRGAAQAVEDAFTDLLIANTGSFFVAGNLNYLAGATYALSPTALDAAVQTMAEQVDAQSKPIIINPRYLVVPPALHGEARRLFASDVLIATGLSSTSAKGVSAANNVYKGLYEPVMVRNLKAAPTSWYLWGDPADIAPFGLAYLNGAENPTIEEVDMPAEYLGRAWRAYLDFGVCQCEKQGAVKVYGA